MCAQQILLAAVGPLNFVVHVSQNPAARDGAGSFVGRLVSTRVMQNMVPGNYSADFKPFCRQLAQIWPLAHSVFW